MRTLFIPHGGGPMPLYDPYSHRPMIELLKSYSNSFTPDYIVVVSAHFATPNTEVLINVNQRLDYDYYGFPEETYKYQYKSPVTEELGTQIVQALTNQGIITTLNKESGFDHGVFVPLMIMYPDASIPVVQISLKSDYNAEFHISLGKALKEILHGNGMLLGSGFSFHNLRTFFQGGEDHLNNAFHDVLKDTILNQNVEVATKLLMDWETFPNAKYVHPTADHFLPLLVCYGMNMRPGTILFDDVILNKRTIAVEWIDEG